MPPARAPLLLLLLLCTARVCVAQTVACLAKALALGAPCGDTLSDIKAAVALPNATAVLAAMAANATAMGKNSSAAACCAAILPFSSAGCLCDGTTVGALGIYLGLNATQLDKSIFPNVGAACGVALNVTQPNGKCAATALAVLPAPPPAAPAAASSPPPAEMVSPPMAAVPPPMAVSSPPPAAPTMMASPPPTVTASSGPDASPPPMMEASPPPAMATPHSGAAARGVAAVLTALAAVAALAV